MLLSINSFLPRLRFTLLTATLLFVLSLNHQAVATLRVSAGRLPHTKTTTAKATFVKQKVTFEATTPLVLWLAPAAEAWQPALEPLRWARLLRRLAVPSPCPSAVANPFGSRLLLAALTPQAP